MVVEISFSIRDCANVIHKADFKGDVKLLSRLRTRLPRQDIYKRGWQVEIWDRRMSKLEAVRS
jgi:hypothetical protein